MKLMGHYQSFDTQFAEIAGLYAAVVFNQIIHLATKAKSMESEILMTAKYKKIVFPYMGTQTVENAIDRLVESGYLNVRIKKNENGAGSIRDHLISLTEKGLEYASATAERGN